MFNDPDLFIGMNGLTMKEYEQELEKFLPP